MSSEQRRAPLRAEPERRTRKVPTRRMDDAHVRESRWSAESVQAREQAREEERRRLGRELHDELGQHLLALKMNLMWLQHRVTRPPEASSVDVTDIRQKLPEILNLVERSINTVTAIVTDLRPPALDQLGLVAALEWQTESFARRTGLRCTFKGAADLDELDVGRATAVFRMFQEMLTNVERHAQANHVSVVIRRAGSRLTLRVCDNGRGLSAAKALEPSSFGLLGMRERAMLLGGSLTIDGARPRGTTVTATIPLANRRTRARAANGDPT